MCSRPCVVRRQHTDFLPVALVLGLVPGRPVTVPIIVVAEDGVTSLRYYVTVVRAPALARPPGAAPAPGNAGQELAYVDPTTGLGSDRGSPGGALDVGSPEGSSVAQANVSADAATAGGLRFSNGNGRGVGLGPGSRADAEAGVQAAAAAAAPKALPPGAPLGTGLHSALSCCLASWAEALMCVHLQIHC